MAIKTQSSKVKSQKLSQAKNQKLSVEEEASSIKQRLNFQLPWTNYRPTKKIYLVILLAGLLLLATYKKSLFIAATVNGSPISNFELLDRINKQYRSQTLNQMINEKIILNEAAKNRIVVQNKEIDNKITQLEKNVGSAQTLDSLLSQQGQTRSSLRDQLKIQLVIEKLYEKDATISAEEITKFIDQNKDQLQATDSAGQEKEATDLLKQQKIGKIFNEKFQQLKQQATTQIF